MYHSFDSLNALKCDCYREAERLTDKYLECVREINNNHTFTREEFEHIVNIKEYYELMILVCRYNEKLHCESMLRIIENVQSKYMCLNLEDKQDKDNIKAYNDFASSYRILERRIRFLESEYSKV